MKIMNILQGISLVIGGIMLWWFPWSSHNTTMIIVTLILILNALWEWFG